MASAAELLATSYQSQRKTAFFDSNSLKDIEIGLLRIGDEFSGLTRPGLLEASIAEPLLCGGQEKSGSQYALLKNTNESVDGYFRAVLIALERAPASFRRRIGAQLIHKVIASEFFL